MFKFSDKTRDIYHTADWLMLGLVVAQVLLAVVNSHITGMDAAFLNNNTAGSFSEFFTLQKIHLIYPAIKYFILQIIIYSLYSYALGLITVSIKPSRKLLYFVFGTSLVMLIFGNLYFVPHSLFSSYLATINHQSAYAVFMTSATILAALVLFAFIQSSYKTRWLLGFTFILSAYLYLTLVPVSVVNSHTSAAKPNVILIGFDALRPDFLSYFKPEREATPNFDKFLQQATVFKNVYTPDARTFPTWLSILTGRYPLHHKGRDDNANLAELDIQTTVASEFKNQGYETIFASDDNRFNNINHEQFGFNRTIGPSGNAIDMMLSNANDNLLSNLFVQTPFGKWLFAEFIGNHGTPQLYHPDDFMQNFKRGLQQRDTTKPLFMAAHFNVTAWPFYFRDGQAPAYDDLALYKRTVQAADNQLAQLMTILQQHNLLDHTIFVLFSDHGITFNLPHDRLIKMSNYQGDKQQSWIKHNNAGVETSSGYGNDLLSLKQNQPLLAVQFFGLPQLHLSTTDERVLLIDIAPTILQLAALPPMLHIDGMNIPDIKPRPIFFETSYSLPEIENGNIDANKVLLKTMANFAINKNNALLTIKPKAAELAIKNKQRAILMGDWLLAYYPAAYQDNRRHSAFSVLLNIKSGLWTTNFQQPLAALAPITELKQKLHDFYGNEMDNYL